MSSAFRWDEKKSLAAIELAQGKTQKAVSEIAKVTDRSIRLWLAEPEFSAEVDRLSLMIGVASRAGRLREAFRVLEQKRLDDGSLRTEKDSLDWLKFIQSETDGIKLDLTSISEAASSMAESRSDRETDKRSKAPRKSAGRKAKG